MEVENPLIVEGFRTHRRLAHGSRQLGVSLSDPFAGFGDLAGSGVVAQLERSSAYTLHHATSVATPT